MDSDMELTPGRLRRGYGPIYRRLSRCGTELSTAEKLVLFNLLERLGQSGSTWPSQAMIAEDTGLSERSVRDGLHALQQRGFLSSKRRGLGLSNVYTLSMSALLTWAERRSTPAENDSRQRQDVPSRTAVECRSERHHVPPKIHQGRSTKEDPPLKIEKTRARANEPIPLFDDEEDDPDDHVIDPDPIVREMDKARIPITAYIRDDLDDWEAEHVPRDWIIAGIRLAGERRAPWSYARKCIETFIRNGGPQETTNGRDRPHPRSDIAGPPPEHLAFVARLKAAGVI